MRFTLQTEASHTEKYLQQLGSKKFPMNCLPQLLILEETKAEIIQLAAEDGNY